MDNLKKVIYVHGFASSGNSHSAGLLRKYLGSGVQVDSADIPVDPIEATDFVRRTVETGHYDLVVGSSLGGFLAMQTPAEVPRIIVNPAMLPSRDLREAIGLGTYPMLSERQDGRTDITIDEEYLAKWQEAERQFYGNCVTPELVQNTYGLFNPDDETLDHAKREAVWMEYFLPEHYYLGEGGHRLTDEAMEKRILPIIRSI